MAIHIDPAKRAVEMIRQHLTLSSAIEAQQWEEMTSAVCALIDRVSMVTCARLEENASIAREIAQAKSNRESQKVASKALLGALLGRVKVIESEIAAIEKKVEQIKKDTAPALEKPKLSCSMHEYKQAMQKIREYYLIHEHSICLSGNKAVLLYNTSPPK